MNHYDLRSDLVIGQAKLLHPDPAARKAWMVRCKCGAIESRSNGYLKDCIREYRDAMCSTCQAKGRELTDTQVEVLAAVATHIRLFGKSPGPQAVGRLLGAPPTAIRNRMTRLQAGGWFERGPNKRVLLSPKAQAFVEGGRASA